MQEMTKIRVEEIESFMSYGAVSLLKKTPIKEACEVIRKRLENDKSPKKRTTLKVDNVMELLTFVLWTTYFRFGGEIYKQKYGVAIGSPLTPSEHVHGGLGAKHHRHSTRGLPTEKLEEICG